MDPKEADEPLEPPRMPEGGNVSLATSAPDDSESAGAGRRRVATIVDVANAANVAVGTVSRYLNGHPVRRGNREQIESAIQAVKFRRNSIAAAMKSSKTHLIGFLAPSFDDFHGGLIEQLSYAIRRDGRALLICCHDADRKVMQEALDYFATQRVDALVMSGAEELYESVDEMVRGGLPVIFYNDDLKGLPADRVFVENRNASCRAVSHLIDLGHRRIAIISGDLRGTSGSERYQGYLNALETRGIAVDPHLVMQGGWSPPGGFDATQRLLALDDPPTAIFSANYKMAAGALRCLKEHELKVPRDMSLVSFDDVDLFDLHEPGITAIAQPTAQIAETIARIIADRLADPGDSSRRTINLSCNIILRGSTRSRF